MRNVFVAAPQAAVGAKAREKRRRHRLPVDQRALSLLPETAMFQHTGAARGGRTFHLQQGRTEVWTCSGTVCT